MLAQKQNVCRQVRTEKNIIYSAACKAARFSSAATLLRIVSSATRSGRLQRNRFNNMNNGHHVASVGSERQTIFALTFRQSYTVSYLNFSMHSIRIQYQRLIGWSYERHPARNQERKSRSVAVCQEDCRKLYIQRKRLPVESGTETKMRSIASWNNDLRH